MRIPMAAAALVAACTTVVLAAPVNADPLQGRYLAANCANCHGTGGRAEPPMPSLAGVPRAQLVAQMRAFKAGTRPATIMHQIAKGYNDAQIDLIADYFAAQASQ